MIDPEAVSPSRYSARLRLIEVNGGDSPSPEARPGSVGGVVVVIPAYNEARFIGSVVLRARKFADQVVVVDDGSSDGTGEVAASAGALVLRHKANLGKGAALNTGFGAARDLDARVVVTLDADGQHLPEEIGLVVAPVLEGKADIIVGSRYMEPRGNVPAIRVLGHAAFNFVTGRLSGMPLTDSQSGFRAFSSRALQAITFNSAGFSVESEMQLLAKEHKLQMVEIPITIDYLDPPKRSVLAHGLMVLTGILRLVGQYRPLLFFGVPGLVLLLVGLGWGLVVVDAYFRLQTLASGYALLAVLFCLLGVLSLFSAVILHSVRGLLIDLVRPGSGKPQSQG